MREYDLIVVGGGSGNMLFGPAFDGWKCAVIEEDRLGGTCLNRGCVPSKMFVVAADVATSARESHRLNVDARFDHVDWPALRDRVFARIDPIHERGMHYRRANGIDVYESRARFVGPKVLEVHGEQLTARHIVVAVGARPTLPHLPGLDSVPFHTSDTIMRIDELPGSMVIIGGGYIAAEMGHVFSAFGTDVSLLQRGPRLLLAQDDDISARFTELASARMRVETGVFHESVTHANGRITITARLGTGSSFEIHADTLLVATGRQPNSDHLDATAGGLELDDHGHVVVDRYQRTNVDGVWAFGDVANHYQLKHMANAEGRVLAHNLAHPDDLRSLEGTLVPAAVFADPQIASVGRTERDARAQGLDVVVNIKPYSDTAYGWALEDTTSFVKVIVDAGTRLILGAHIIGPNAALLLQPLVQAMTFGQTADQIAREVIYIHPALAEAVEQALLELP